MTETNEWIPIEAAAAALQTTRLNVLMQIKRGLLEGEEDAAGWRVTRQSLERFLAVPAAERTAAVCRSGCPTATGCGGCR